MANEPSTLLAHDVPPSWAPKIKVVGLGGGGGNVLNTMTASGVTGVELIACHTKVQALESSLAKVKVRLGAEVTRGFGCGGDPDRGRAATGASLERVREVLTGADMVFVVAGMGRGTGSGGTPLVAGVARELGALTVGVVTTPFPFEGRQKMQVAREGINALEKTVDALLVISNEKLIGVVGQTTSMVDAFRQADDVLGSAIAGLSEIVLSHGMVNVDFADVRTVMQQSGRALMGTGRATGERRAMRAAEQAIRCPLLEDPSIDGATGLLIHVTSGPDLTLAEMNEAVLFMQQAIHEEATIIYGHFLDAEMADEVRITAIATGVRKGPLAP